MYTKLKFYFLDFPKDGPKITTIPKGRNEYRVGDTANLMCKAQKSSPPTQLSWYINGEPVSILKLFDNLIYCEYIVNGQLIFLNFSYSTQKVYYICDSHSSFSQLEDARNSLTLIPCYIKWATKNCCPLICRTKTKYDTSRRSLTASFPINLKCHCLC